LVTEPIDKVLPAGVATTVGETRDVDVLVLATGFQVMDVDSGTYRITGTGERALAEFWSTNRMQAYEGVSIPGFPNFSDLLAGHLSISQQLLLRPERRRADPAHHHAGSRPA
jgi:cation diffusion facilitator CzcD-associated flavoprotein CzcO